MLARLSFVHRLYLIVCFPSFKVTHTNFLFCFQKLFCLLLQNLIPDSTPPKLTQFRWLSDKYLHTNAWKQLFTYFLLYIKACNDESFFIVFFFHQQKTDRAFYTCQKLNTKMMMYAIMSLCNAFIPVFGDDLQFVAKVLKLTRSF